jgi:transglutaminase/protease-like cytokinesis protein 3
MINGNWKTKLNNYYFKLKKGELNLTHYPSEKKWLDFMNQKALNQFCEEPIFNTVFFASNAKLLFPRKGTIIIKKRKDKIQLKLKDIKSYSTILYSYNSEKFAKKPTINSYGSHTEIIINSPH